MPERLSKAERSHVMSLVKSTNTSPELIVRRLVHAMGFRYRLHVRTLPGTPDLVFPRLRKIINIHGCFWHAHPCKRGKRIPQTNRGFWLRKRRRNAARDRRTGKTLARLGWKVLTGWECELRDAVKLRRRLRVFLRG